MKSKVATVVPADEIPRQMTLLASDDSIETDRLRLRRITPNDLSFYTRIHADVDVARYLGHGRPRSLEESTTWLDKILDGYRELEMGQVAITRKSDGALVGRCGVSHLETPLDPEPDGTFVGYYYPMRAPTGIECLAQAELGYTLDRNAWGHGYAREAVRGLREYLRARRPELRLVSLIHPENTRSLRLASSFGVSLVDRVMYSGLPYDRYAWPAGNSPSIER